MRKVAQCSPCFQLLAFFLLFVLVFMAKSNIADAFKEPNTIEPIVKTQSQITGDWTAEFGKRRPRKHDDNEPEEIQQTDLLNLNLKRSSDQGTNNFGSSHELSDFQGLTREQVMGSSNVNFSLQREAGTFQFEGTFAAGKGSGHFTLTPNQNFVSAMSSRGYDLTKEKQLASAILDVRVKTVDDLKAAGFHALTLEDVFKATIFKITPEFAREMNAIGYKNLEMEDLVKARIFKIDARFAREVKEMGFGENQPLETLIKMRIFKITPEFLREIQSAGLENLNIEDLVKLKIFKIDRAFIESVQASSNQKLDVEDLVRKKIRGKIE